MRSSSGSLYAATAPAAWVRSDSRVFVDLSQEQIKSSPVYEGPDTLNRDFESRLYRHYGRSQYWVD